MAFHIGGDQSLDRITRDSFGRAAREVGLGSRFALKCFDDQCQRFPGALKAAVEELSGLGFERAERIGQKILKTSGYRNIG